MDLFPKRINVYSGTWTPGVSRVMSATEALRKLVERPGNKFPYVKGIRHRAACTIAETKAGAGVTFPVAKQLQMLRSVTLEHDSNPRCVDKSFLDVIKESQQMQEVFGPDYIGDRLPTSAIATGAGVTAKTLDFIQVLAPGLYKRGHSGRAKHTGVISVASLIRSGKLEVWGTAVTNMTGGGSDYWSCTAITYDCWLELYYSDYPLEEVQVQESFAESSTPSVLAPWDGERRLLGAVVADDADSDFVTNLSNGIVTIDGNTIDTSVSTAESVVETNTMRLDGINDIFPAVAPVVTLAARDVDECPVIHSSFKLENFNSGHSGNYRLVCRQSKRYSLDAQIQKFKLQKVPQKAIDAYVASVNGRTVTEAREEIGLAVRMLVNEDALGVQEYNV